MSRMPDHYRVLQVDPEADADVITAAYRTLARRLHPDRDITGVDEYRMSELNRAYAVLRDPTRRRQYDAERSLEPRAVGPGFTASPGPEPERRGGLAERWAEHAARVAAGANGSTAGANGSAAGPGAEAAPLPGDTKLAFGRYAGMSLRQIAGQDADYLRWLGRHSSGLRYRREIQQLLKESL